jgi:hypothetical protein
MAERLPSRGRMIPLRFAPRLAGNPLLISPVCSGGRYLAWVVPIASHFRPNHDRRWFSARPCCPPSSRFAGSFRGRYVKYVPIADDRKGGRETLAPPAPRNTLCVGAGEPRTVPGLGIGKNSETPLGIGFGSLDFAKAPR